MTPNGLPNSNVQSIDEIALLHAAALANNNYLGSSNNPNQANIQVVAKEPWVDEPSGSLPLDLQSGIVIPAIDAVVFTIVINYTIPQGWDAIFDGYNLNAISDAFVEFQGDLIWQFTIDGRVIEGFDNVINSRGSIQVPRPMHTIKVTQGQTIAIQVRHAANGALAGITVCGLKGYRYPKLGN